MAEPATSVPPAAGDDLGRPPGARRRPAPRLLLAMVALLVVPMAVSAVDLLVVGGGFWPTSDIALIEMQVRDVGREAVTSGLYSRVDWSHPGPAQFYVLAPFYWLTGGSPVGTFLGALAVNAAAVVGMAVVAWRRGGAPMLLVTALATSLLLRTLGADFVRDPWNCFLTVLPFGLAIFLVWALASGDLWAWPVAVGVVSFVAQAHVGYLVLAVPLLAVGALWAVVDALRHTDPGRRRALVRPALVGVGVGLVLWLPPVVDVLTGPPSNPGRVLQYFRGDEGATSTLTAGWNVLAAQFSTLPEWLTWHRQPTWWSGEPPALHDPPVPWVLAAVAVAGAVLWRVRIIGGVGRLAATFVVAFGLGVVAISRVVGPVFDYRLRWTWIVGMVGFVLVAVAAWSLVDRRWARAGRVLGPATVAAVVVLAAANVADAVGAGVPYGDDSEALEAVLPAALAALDGVDGEVLVTDTLGGSWYARGVVSELERAGIDARVPADRAELFGDHRVVGDGEPAARLQVAVNQELAMFDADPGLRRLSSWSALSDERLADVERRLAAIDAELEDGRLEPQDHAVARQRVIEEISVGSDAFARSLALYLDTAPRT